MAEDMLVSPQIREKYQPVIGLEIHIQMQVESKMFATEAFVFGSEPNQHISPITLAHPGALPSINERCVQHAITLGLATHCHIPAETYFARKNYFYPDLPKGYQLSQAENPICQEGFLEVPLPEGRIRKIRIERIHLEEDAGKSIHDQDPRDTLIDLNRAGVGLMELVTHPDLRSTEEAVAFAAEVRKLVRYLEVGDGNMEQGNLRCDANVSVMLHDATEFGTRVEVKNINSLTNLGKAINYEIDRQVALVDRGEAIRRATRGWDVQANCTRSLRDKETADDYRYFPEPDLQPVRISQETLKHLREALPVLPFERYQRYTEALGFTHQEALALTDHRPLVEYFERMLAHAPDARAAYNWLMGPIKSYLNEHSLDIVDFPVPAERIMDLNALVAAEKVSHNAAKAQVLPALINEPSSDPAELAQRLNVRMESNEAAIEAAMDALIEQFPDETERYRKGRKGLMGFFVGQIMKQFKGKANPKEVNKVVRQKLDQG